MVFFLYRVFTFILFVVGLLCSPLLLLAGKRYRAGFAQRLGFYPAAVLGNVKDMRPIWLHAASVGEALAAAPLSRELKAQWPERRIVVSTFTHTGNEVARRAAAADACIFLPLDQAWVVRRALRALNPSLLIVIETEIWPNLLREANRKGIPIVLLSGRLSERSLRRYRWFRGFFARVLQSINAFGMQTRADAERILSLGAPAQRVTVCGNLKHAASRDLEYGERHARVADGLYFIAGSSHRGEEEIVLKVFRSLKARFPQLRLVLAPRHPQRFLEVEALLAASGMAFEKKSAVNGRVDFASESMFVDTIGDLLNFYAIGDVAFVGGSLVDEGGHNVLEPARFGKPVLFGPHMNTFRELAAEMKQRGAGIEVQNEAELCGVLGDLLANADRRREIGERAYQMASEDRGVLNASMELARRYIQ